MWNEFFIFSIFYKWQHEISSDPWYRSSNPFPTQISPNFAERAMDESIPIVTLFYLEKQFFLQNLQGEARPLSVRQGRVKKFQCEYTCRTFSFKRIPKVCLGLPPWGENHEETNFQWTVCLWWGFVHPLQSGLLCREAVFFIFKISTLYKILMSVRTSILSSMYQDKKNLLWSQLVHFYSDSK